MNQLGLFQNMVFQRETLLGLLLGVLDESPGYCNYDVFKLVALDNVEYCFKHWTVCHPAVYHFDGHVVETYLCKQCEKEMSGSFMNFSRHTRQSNGETPYGKHYRRRVRIVQEP